MNESTKMGGETTGDCNTYLPIVSFQGRWKGTGERKILAVLAVFVFLLSTDDVLASRITSNFWLT